MSWQASTRGAAQRLGIDPRYLRRARWLAKAGAVRSVGARIGPNLRYVLLDPEPHNFTYELLNEDELAAWVASLTGSPVAGAAELLAEAREDDALAQRLVGATSNHWLWTKASPPLGKRRAWYALARTLKPALVVETGVHDGLGSLVLLRALERNAADGHPGRLVSFDVNPAAGWIVGSDPLWELRIEATATGLAPVLERHGPLGLFIHDSLHTYENERFELHAAAAHLSPAGVLVSDNAHATRAFEDTCADLGLECRLFRERPAGHFYTGGVMGGARRRSWCAPDRLDGSRLIRSHARPTGQPLPHALRGGGRHPGADDPG